MIDILVDRWYRWYRYKYRFIDIDIGMDIDTDVINCMNL